MPDESKGGMSPAVGWFEINPTCSPLFITEGTGLIFQKPYIHNGCQFGAYTVVAGVPPAVEPGIRPGGARHESLQGTRDFTDFGKLRAIIPGGRMPPYTAARMAAATTPMQLPAVAPGRRFACAGAASMRIYGVRSVI